MAARNGDHVVFDGWTGGHYGKLDPGVAGKSDTQMFYGIDMMVYENGLIGPRPGPKEVTFTSPPNGEVIGGAAYLDSGGDVTFQAILKTGASSFDARNYNITDSTVGSAYTETNAIPGTIPYALHPSGGYLTGGYYIIQDEGVYQFDATGAEVTLVDTDPDGQVINFYGARLVASSLADPGRLWYSDALAWGTFGANNYVDIFSGQSHTFYAPFRDGLILGTGFGGFGIVTGVLGSTTTVRELTRGGAPPTPHHGLRVADDQIWYYNGTDQYPGVFNGAVHERYEYLEEEGKHPTVAGSNPAYPSRLMVEARWAGTDDWVAYSRDIDTGPTHHRLNGVMTASSIIPDFYIGGFALSHLLVVNNGTGSSPDFYWYGPGTIDRPAVAADDYCSPTNEMDGTDPVTADLSTPYWFSEDGSEVRVNEVIVDLLAYDVGLSTDAGFSVSVTAVPREGGDPLASTTKAVSIAYGDASAAGVERRIKVGMGDQGFAAGFQINLTDVLGCAIRRITAVLSPETRRP